MGYCPFERLFSGSGAGPGIGLRKRLYWTRERDGELFESFGAGVVGRDVDRCLLVLYGVSRYWWSYRNSSDNGNIMSEREERRIARRSRRNSMLKCSI